MNRFVIIALLLAGCDLPSDPKIDRILKAKETVRDRLNHPDTADFHEMEMAVRGNAVHLKVTAKKAFGVPSTHTFDINVP